MMMTTPYTPFFSSLPGLGASGPDFAQFELQTINLFLQDAASAAIRKLSAYIEANSLRFPVLAAIAPIVGHAAEAFRNHEYANALAQAYAAYRQIVMLRAAVPDLPNP
jgi:hypothetical protein